MPKLWRKRVLLAKVESTYGTDAAPAATDAVLARSLELEVEAELLERELVRPTLGNLPALSAMRRCRVRAEVELAGPGAAGTTPAWGRLLRGCGLSETVTAGTKVDYQPATDGHESLTLHWFADGVVHKVTGARGTASLRLEAGQIPVLTFEFTGLYQDPTDQALPTADVSAWKTPVIPSRAETPTFDLHGISCTARSFELDIANGVIFRDLVGASDVLVTDRAPRGSASIEAVPTSVKNWFATARQGTLGPFSLVHGTTAGSIVEITAPAVQVRTVRYEEADSVVFQTLELGFTEQSGDDELTITAR